MSKPAISSDLAGTGLRDFETTVSWREIMNYSAAVGDDNPRYFDDENPGGIIAHPVFPVAITWNILGRIQDFIDSESFPMDLLLTQVHFSEHLALHRPVAPGMRLVVTGRIAAILPHRAGTHVVLRLDARDHDGSPVFTEHIGAMLRGVECLGGGAGKESLPVTRNADDAAGPVWVSARPVDRLMPFVYDGCTNIVFPIHTSVKFARMVGLPGIILQGTATLACAVTEIVNRELGGDPARVGSISCRFTGMVLPGSQIAIRMIEKKGLNNGIELLFDVHDVNGVRAISGGCLTAAQG